MPQLVSRGTIVGWTIQDRGVLLRVGDDRPIGEVASLYFPLSVRDALIRAGQIGFSVEKCQRQTQAWVETGQWPQEEGESERGE